MDGGGDGGDTDGDGEDNEQPDPDSIVEDTNIKSGYGLVSEDLFGDSNEELIVADGSGNIRIMTLSGSSLTTEQEWNGGYPMNGGGGVTVSMNGHDNPWIIHGGDAGVVVAWEVTESEHSMVWKSVSGSNGGETLYSLEGGNTYGVAMGNIDDDDSLEILVGSGSGQVYAFDGETYEMDWVSPVMEKLPIGIAISDLNNDGDSESGSWFSENIQHRSDIDSHFLLKVKDYIRLHINLTINMRLERPAVSHDWTLPAKHGMDSFSYSFLLQSRIFVYDVTVGDNSLGSTFSQFLHR
mgnify:CR=1 FL=1